MMTGNRRGAGRRAGSGLVLVAWATAGAAAGAERAAPLNFDFGPGRVAPGHVQVLSATSYTSERGYGFLPGAAVACLDRGGDDPLRGDVCSSDRPFVFAIDVPEGNYEVTVVLGDAAGPTSTTVKAEARRLMVERADTQAGGFETRTFTVNVRASEIRPGESVALKPREKGHLDWDGRLTLELNGAHPSLAALSVTRVEDAITVYLAGDSTVTDQSEEPWASWGQMLPRFFERGVAVANHAESGEALKSFLAERRLEKILTTLRSGDYLFVQFAHNDQKPGAAHTDAFTTYQEHLRLYIGEARSRGAIPVLVTSMLRRRFDANGRVVDTLEDYPEAMRQVARREGVALIDLHAMSRVFYEALGPERSTRAFVHYPAGTFPGQERALADDSHFNAYGAYELAKCVVEGIRQNRLGLVQFLVDDLPAFDPSKPDPVDTWSLPSSPFRPAAAPEGS